MTIPEAGRERLQAGIDRARMEKKRAERARRRSAWTAAAAMIVLIALPNTNVQIAHAMENIPVLGGFFRLVTVRQYNYSDENHDAEIELAQITYGEDGEGTPVGEVAVGAAAPDNADVGNAEGAGQEAGVAKLSEEGVQEINQDMETTVDELIRQFEDTLSEEGYHGLHVSQEVVTDNAQYYTVKLSALETEASGYEHNQFYTIDKQTGNVAERADFLDAGGCELTKADHVHLTARGHRQLAERMETAVREILEAPEAEVAEGEGGKENDEAGEIVTAKEADLPRILEIYDIAKAYMRANGNPNQWNGVYPDPETLRTDIEKQRLYVYKRDGRIHGVFMLLLEEEPTYAYIEDGSWREEAPYGTIHRLAGDGEVKGLFAKCVAFCEKKVPYLRADTHFDNHTMQHLLEKNGFERRGIIYLKNGDPRIAYQK